MYVIDYTRMEQQDQLSIITLSGMCMCIDSDNGNDLVSGVSSIAGIIDVVPGLNKSYQDL